MADATLVVVPQPRHPLSQMAASGTHRLLLMQWLKEEDLAHRVALREARLDGARKEIAFLYCAFFAFHAASVLILFLSSSSPGIDPSSAAACRRSWIPCLVPLLSSLAMLWALRYKADTEAVLEQLLARERGDAVLLGRCVAELKRKGLEFAPAPAMDDYIPRLQKGKTKVLRCEPTVRKVMDVMKEVGEKKR